MFFEECINFGSADMGMGEKGEGGVGGDDSKAE